jgi:hypothetical protein
MGSGVDQLLWFETLLKLSSGLLLALVPLTVIKILGLPPAESAFWPRLLGSVLVGLSGATFLEGAMASTRGLGLAGAIVINLAAAAMIALSSLLGGGATTRRGKLVQWGIVTLLFALSLAEIARA